MFVFWLWQKPQVAAVLLDSTRAQAEGLAAVVSQAEATRDDADRFRSAQKLGTSLLHAQATSRRQHQNSRAFSRVSVQKDLSELCEDSEVGSEALRYADALTECRQTLEELFPVKDEEDVPLEDTSAPSTPVKPPPEKAAYFPPAGKRQLVHLYAAAAAGGGDQQQKLQRLSSAGSTPYHPRKGRDNFLTKCLSTSSEEGETVGAVYSSEEEEDLVLPEKKND